MGGEGKRKKNKLFEKAIDEERTERDRPSSNIICVHLTEKTLCLATLSHPKNKIFAVNCEIEIYELHSILIFFPFSSGKFISHRYGW